MLITEHTVISTFCIGSIQDIEHKRGQDCYCPCTSGAWDIAMTQNK